MRFIIVIKFIIIREENKKTRYVCVCCWCTAQVSLVFLCEFEWQVDLPLELLVFSKLFQKEKERKVCYLFFLVA